MSGTGNESPWTPQQSVASREPAPAPTTRGPRWIISLRALVVVLAMIAAALGVLWIESASVQGASAELNTQDSPKVAVPPLVGATVSSPASASVGAGSASAGQPATGAAEPTAGLLVHVAGAVKSPGVFTLPPGSRVFQAVAAAGGALPTAELAALNLAAQLRDGSQILVPTKGQIIIPGGPADPSRDGSAGHMPGASALVNLNTGSAADFDTLPGVGPVLAQRIVDWRTAHGPFASVDALDAVAGIGAKLLAGLRDLVTL